MKLGAFRGHYRDLPDSMKPRFEAMVRANLTDEDREFYRSGKVKRRVARFCKMVIDGGPFAYRAYQTVLSIRSFLKSAKKKVA